MRTRHTLSLVFAASLAACGQSHGIGADAGVLPGDATASGDGGGGVCCAIDEAFEGCSPGLPGRAAGGWAARPEDCASHTISGFDGQPFERQLDDRGCPVLVEVAGCCGCVDAGPPPSECDGLGPAACLAALCVPVFDDACCPLCGEEPGPCADCVRPTYTGCLPDALSPCRGGPACGTAPTWGCGPAAPECGSARVVARDACDVTGCVPAYPSGEGEPAIETASCVPIVGTSCTVACRRLAPPCPTGTTAEGDGSCYTDRCIPAFVCE